MDKMWLVTYVENEYHEHDYAYIVAGDESRAEHKFLLRYGMRVNETLSIMQIDYDKDAPYALERYNHTPNRCECQCGYDFYEAGHGEFKYCPMCARELDWGYNWNG